jgi:hypothetical protein
MTRMSEIPPELLAEMTPAVRAFVESLMLQMAEMQARMQAEIDDLKAQVKKLTPKNSSVPPLALVIGRIQLFMGLQLFLMTGSAGRGVQKKMQSLLTI